MARAATIPGLLTGATPRIPTTETPLSDLTLRAFADRLASADPAPGGGSASAVAGALGAALLAMVSELSIGRPASAAHETTLIALRDAALRLRTQLMELADADAVAYTDVVAARRLPRATDAEQAARATALTAATAEATRAPLRIARAAGEVAELAERLAPIGNPHAASDVAVGALLADAALRGAAANVRINLPGLAVDDPLRAEAEAELRRLEPLGAARTKATLATIEGRIGPS